MSTDALLDLLRLLATLPRLALVRALEEARTASPIEAALVAALLLAGAGAMAAALQWRWSRRLDREGAPPIGLGEALVLEITHSPLFLPFKPVQLAGRGLILAGGLVASLPGRLRRRPGPGTDLAAGPDAAPPPAPARGTHPLLVASLGPSFLAAALATVALYAAARIADPLLAAELHLSRGFSAWAYLAFGRHADLAWLLPVGEHPHLAALLALALWLTVGWAAGSVVRLARLPILGRNLAAHADDGAALPFWRTWAGAPALWRAAPSVRMWALPCLAALAPLVVWGWLHLAGEPYRLGGAAWAVAAVVWTCWLLALLLAGRRREGAAPEEEVAAPPASHGWPDVLAYLESALRVTPPEPVGESPVAAPEPAAGEAAEVVSPLVLELLARATGAAGLTRMQHDVLGALAGSVHAEPSASLDRLALGGDGADGPDGEDGHGRHQVVLAPEGWGKTTLALLAVADHALLHTRASLLIASTERRATELHGRLRAAVDPSTLRWNLRVRALGPELMNDLARRIAPDVLVLGLHDLVVSVLDRTETFAPFLRNVGLLVVDDVESFAGPTEIHAQLAFRRLLLQIEELTGAEALGGPERSVPRVLALGTDGMDETSEWAQSLLGVDAVTRRYAGPADAEPPAGATPAAIHRRYRLRDFRRPGGEPLGVERLVGACEALAVPWHYRLCGDGLRDLGRGPLYLPEEPRHAVEGPEDACVVLLEGSWSEVERERRRLARAGDRFAARRRGGLPEATEAAGAEPIALVTLVDPDLETAFGELDEHSPLRPVLDRLPRPVIRPPTGRAVLSHLAADLTQRAIEVADVVEVFGTPVADVLRDLARDGLLEAIETRDVAARSSEYVRRVHVKALARAIGAEGRESEGTLPHKVARVDLVCRSTVAVRDRTSLTTLFEADAASAHLAYYPGRIFRDARGTFVVVEHTGGDVLVEPLLGYAVSSPRRRIEIAHIGSAEGDDELSRSAGGELFGPDPVLMGRFPLALGLLPVRVRVEHVATYRLGPFHHRVRQRSVTAVELRDRLRERHLETVALAILPQSEEAARHGAPALTLDAARLLAAVLRAVLPSTSRGAAGTIAVALHVAEALGPSPGLGPEHELGPDDGLYLLDLDAGGNGTARAVYRDGVDVLLRLCRRVVERVGSTERLRALHDEWADLEEILAEGSEVPDGDRPDPDPASARLLDWLDSRLLPEDDGGGSDA